MIERIGFKNFKALREATLPLGPFTLIVGPNGSGKSTALQGLVAASKPGSHPHQALSTSRVSDDVVVNVEWGRSWYNKRLEAIWHHPSGCTYTGFERNDNTLSNHQRDELKQILKKARVYALDPNRIAQPVDLVPNIELSPDGFGLACVLDRMRDGTPERFQALNAELNRWLPEYDQILFGVPAQGLRSFSLRTTSGHEIFAADLSHGTLLAIAILTIAYLPDPPPLVAFEDPDRGIHPRLLRDVQDAMYRLAYPENYGETREPVQVIATTHSPYLLDLYKEHPEEIVIAHKQGTDATFERLSDRPDIDEILQDASLGEVWYSGILGGVPAET